MPQKKKMSEFDPSLFLEEIKKRVHVPQDQLEEFLKFWEFRKFKRNEFILRAGEIPMFSIFVRKGCLRQYLSKSHIFVMNSIY